MGAPFQSYSKTRWKALWAAEATLGMSKIPTKVGSGNGCSRMAAHAKAHFYHSEIFKLAPRWDKFISVLGNYAEEETRNIWHYNGLSFIFYGLGKPSCWTSFIHAPVPKMATHAPVHSRILSTFLHLAVTSTLDNYLQYRPDYLTVKLPDAVHCCDLHDVVTVRLTQECPGNVTPLSKAFTLRKRGKGHQSELNFMLYVI